MVQAELEGRGVLLQGALTVCKVLDLEGVENPAIHRCSVKLQCNQLAPWRLLPDCGFVLA